MTAGQLLQRKWKAGLSDLQALVMLALAEKEMASLTDLAEHLGRAVPSVSMAAQVLEDSGFVVKDKDGRPFTPVYFYLSDEGKKLLGWLLGKG